MILSYRISKLKRWWQAVTVLMVFMYWSVETKPSLLSLQNQVFCNSFAIWHAHLGHVLSTIISILNKQGFMSLTSILPNPSLCVSCQKAKSHKLPFPTSDSRSNTILGLIHCDLWGPTPITSISGYRYYVIFIDDHSLFTWFYPLKHNWFLPDIP
jgi:hypothetical protein